MLLSLLADSACTISASRAFSLRSVSTLTSAASVSFVTSQSISHIGEKYKGEAPWLIVCGSVAKMPSISEPQATQTCLSHLCADVCVLIFDCELHQRTIHPFCATFPF